MTPKREAQAKLTVWVRDGPGAIPHQGHFLWNDVDRGESILVRYSGKPLPVQWPLILGGATTAPGLF